VETSLCNRVDARELLWYVWYRRQLEAVPFKYEQKAEASEESSDDCAGFFALRWRERYGVSAEGAPIARKNDALGINTRLPTRT
jgi:hypothetical protein